jgi:hypothetical protein
LQAGNGEAKKGGETVMSEEKRVVVAGGCTKVKTQDVMSNEIRKDKIK